MTLRQKYFGNKHFYKHIFMVMLPIMVQNAITNFVNMLDNLMVGRLGTVEMSSVSVSNMLVFVYNLSIFGAVSGAGIFTAQYHGKNDTEGVRNTFRFKMLIALGLTLGAGLIFIFFGEQLISLYLKGEGDPADAAAILALAKQYIAVILIGLIPNALTQSFSSTLRETDNGVPPMIAGLIAVFVNLILNFILIFGHFGAPRLGVVGAAIATVASRFVELIFVAAWTLRNKKKAPFIVGVFRNFRIPGALCRQIILKGLPLMMNETLWAAGIAFLEQCYSTRGLHVVAACNISNTFFNVFSVAFISSGSAVGIIVGQQLGAGKIREAREDAPRLITFMLILGIAIALIYAGVAFVAPHLYNTDADVRRLATELMLVTAAFLPFDAMLNGSYFMVRSGGKTLITMLTDCGMLWSVQVVAAFFISRFTDLPIIPLFAIVESGMILKCAVSLWFVRQGKWANRIVAE